MTLFNKTLNLLRNRPKWMSFTTIEKETGISKDWLKKFSQGKISNPGVNTIQELYEYLSGDYLDV